ncbi:hypothetical protein HWQ46_19000 [Shewanella sp. D64]|uniref:hypothetical protein n=1 Tax=unclassified Shewanella TaxID=196818 RepID=UPI0022BA18E2|nr:MULTISPECIES: hypothetical protein [unclassified Shewanella]MEC4727638.1 hypothetical protein [Shewanella sp. D64]MEC4739789.1 hypothetical protein [Shewanella sp. E94]WBJ94037.1 hypothetical protein HWQ47_19315 [Shewanella sp. MTB7]
MKQISFIMLSVFLCGVALSSSVKSETLKVCNSCESSSNFYVKARSFAIGEADKTNEGFKGYITVGNAKSGKVYRWYISASWLMSGGDEPDLVIRSNTINVGAETAQIFLELSNTGLMRQARSGYDIPASSGLASAWDVARETGNHHLFDNYVHDNYPVTYWSNEVANIVGEFSLSFLVGIEIQLNFDDGTSIRVIMAPINTGDVVLKYVPGSSTYTKSGTNIPDKGQPLEGTYHFSDANNLQSFLNKLSDKGVPFTVIRGAGGTGKVTINPVSPK